MNTFTTTTTTTNTVTGRKAKAMAKVAKATLANYKATKRNPDIFFKEDIDGIEINSYTKAYEKAYKTQVPYASCGYQMAENALGQPLRGDIIELLIEDNFGCEYLRLTLEALSRVNGTEGLLNIFSDYTLVSLLNKGVSIRSLFDVVKKEDKYSMGYSYFNEDMLNTYSLGYCLDYYEDVFKCVKYHETSSIASKEVISKYEIILEKDLFKYTSVLDRYIVTISDVATILESDGDAASLLRACYTDEMASLISCEDFITHVDKGHMRVLYKKLGMRYFDAEKVNQAYGLIKKASMIDYQESDLTKVNLKIVNKFINGCELKIDNSKTYDGNCSDIVGFEDYSEIFFLTQVLGNEIFNVEEAREGHYLLNMYRVNVCLLDEPLNQKWNQFFRKNLSSLKHLNIALEIFGENPPKSKQQLDKEVLKVRCELIGAGADRLLWAGVPEYELDNAFRNVQEYTPKSKDLLPKVDIEDGDYSLSRLATGDAASLFIGIATDCCQHLGSVGKDCAIDSYENEQSSVYVLTKNGKPVAQSWAWTTEDGSAIVIDSIEFKRGVSKSVIANFWTELVMILNLQGIDVYISDTSYGCTKDVVNILEGRGFVEAFTSASYVEYTGYEGYMDGRTHFLINVPKGV